MEKTKIKLEIGYVSLVGILAKEYPLSYGNYFSCGGYHMLNMWYENLKHLIKTGVLKEDDELEGTVFGRGIVITDPKIPAGYLNKKMCFTGGGGVDDIDALYRFFYPEYRNEKCMCTAETNYVSYMNLMWAQPSFESGKCNLCDRKIYMNEKKEINAEEFSRLMSERNKK